VLAWRWSAFIRTHTHACCTHALPHMYSYTVSHVTDALAQGVVLVLLVQQSAQRACDMRLHTHACATAYVLMRFLMLAQGSFSGPTKYTEGLRHHAARSAWCSSCHGAPGWKGKKRKKENLRHHPEGVLCSRYAVLRQHTAAYVSIRQHTSAYVSIRGEVGLILRMYI
jgi:cytochrome c553